MVSLPEIRNIKSDLSFDVIWYKTSVYETAKWCLNNETTVLRYRAVYSTEQLMI